MENFHILWGVLCVLIVIGVLWPRCRNKRVGSKIGIPTPTPIWCQLHRKGKNDFKAMVLIHLDGRLTAPRDESLRVLQTVHTVDTGLTLGAPTWVEKETRTISGLDGQSVRFIMMLGAVYTFPFGSEE